MTQLKFLYLIANLVFVRLAVGTIISTSEELSTTPSGSSSASLFDNINSLDFSPSSQLNTTHVDFSTQDHGYLSKNDTNRAGKSHQPAAIKKQNLRKKAKSNNSMAHLVLNLLGQLEKVDMKRLISDSLAQFAASPGRQSASEPVKGRNSSTDKHQANNGNSTSKQSAPHNRDQRLNVSAVTADTGNLLSITEQLVKLARSSMIGGDYAYGGVSPYSASSWSMSPVMAPSMLSAASHILHDSLGHDFTGASLKSDWFWLVAPAVIVIGAGVIVIPMIGAWLVSHMMNQNTFTVAAGRRRKRSIDGSYGGHDELLRLLNIHQLLDDAPELLVNKLGEFHRVLDSVGAKYIDSALIGRKQDKKKSN